MSRAAARGTPALPARSRAAPASDSPTYWVVGSALPDARRSCRPHRPNGGERERAGTAREPHGNARIDAAASAGRRCRRAAAPFSRPLPAASHRPARRPRRAAGPLVADGNARLRRLRGVRALAHVAREAARKAPPRAPTDCSADARREGSARSGAHSARLFQIWNKGPPTTPRHLSPSGAGAPSRTPSPPDDRLTTPGLARAR